MRARHWQAAALVAALLWGGAGPAAACRLALALALDISSSVDPLEDRAQREGLADALVSPEVVAALLASAEEPVALAVFEWSGRYQQDMLLEWRLLDSRTTIETTAEELRRSARSYAEFPTSVGYALGYAAEVFSRAPACLFKTLDISGDGINNDGFPPRMAYENFPLADVTVNALVVFGGGRSGQDDMELLQFYSQAVIRGPGSFVEVAEDYEDYARAMRRKLLREVASRAIGLGDPPAPAPVR